MHLPMDKKDISTLSKALSLEEARTILGEVEKHHPKLVALAHGTVFEYVNMHYPMVVVPSKTLSVKKLSSDEVAAATCPVRAVTVGFKPFSVKESVLKEECCLFARGHPACFPDRDPGLFKDILRLLYGDLSSVAGYTPEYLNRLEKEIEFYGFGSLLRKPLVSNVMDLSKLDPEIRGTITYPQEFFNQNPCSGFEEDYGTRYPCADLWFRYPVTVTSISVRCRLNSPKHDANKFKVNLLAGFSNEKDAGEGERYVGHLPANNKGITVWRPVASEINGGGGMCVMVMNPTPICGQMFRLLFSPLDDDDICLDVVGVDLRGCQVFNLIRNTRGSLWNQ